MGPPRESWPGRLMRTSIDSIGPPASGGRQRPSNVWHAEQDTRLNVGPRPSNLAVELGAITQLVLNNRLPNEKFPCLSVGRLAAGMENASLEDVKVVVSP